MAYPPFVGWSIASDRPARNVRLRLSLGKIRRWHVTRLPACPHLHIASRPIIPSDCCIKEEILRHCFCLPPFSEHYFHDRNQFFLLRKRPSASGWPWRGRSLAGPIRRACSTFSSKPWMRGRPRTGRISRRALPFRSNPAPRPRHHRRARAIAMADGPKPFHGRRPERRVLDQIPNPKAASWTPHKCVLPQLYATWVTGRAWWPPMVEPPCWILRTRQERKAQVPAEHENPGRNQGSALHISAPITPGAISPSRSTST